MAVIEFGPLSPSPTALIEVMLSTSLLNLSKLLKGVGVG